MGSLTALQRTVRVTTFTYLQKEVYHATLILVERHAAQQRSVRYKERKHSAPTLYSGYTIYNIKQAVLMVVKIPTNAQGSSGHFNTFQILPRHVSAYGCHPQWVVSAL
jgi:hypothetical protein